MHREHGAIADTFEGVVIFKDDVILGSCEDFLTWAKEKFGYIDMRPLPFYYSVAKDAYNEYITSQDRCLVYMDISVEGEPYGRLVFEVRTSVYVFYVCFGFKWSILYIYVCMLSLYVCSFSHLYALKHVKTSKLCVQERRGQHRKTLLCVTRTPLSTELSLMDGYKEETYLVVVEAAACQVMEISSQMSALLFSMTVLEPLAW
jgi:hypothetical protein